LVIVLVAGMAPAEGCIKLNVKERLATYERLSMYIFGPAS